MITNNPAFIADAVLAIITLLAIAALICGVLAGNFMKKAFAQRLSDGLIRPFADNLLKKAEQSINFSSLASDISAEAGGSAAAAELPDLSGVDLSGVDLSGINIPGVDLQSVISGMKIDKTIGGITDNLRSSVSDAANAAADTLALNIAGVVLFVLTALIVFILVKFILNKLLGPLVSSIPVVGGINRLAGAVLGAAEGLIISGAVLFAAYKLSPMLPEAVQKIFEPKAIEGSLLVKQFFLRLPGVFTMPK